MPRPGAGKGKHKGKKPPPRPRRIAQPPELPHAPESRPERACDVLVIGAGAAGLFAALSARGALDAKGEVTPIPARAPDVVLLNNEPRLGLKILVSGGSRCNLTNARVDQHDYESDAPHVVKRQLRGFTAQAARRFFEARGCKTYEEPLGKVFPRSDDAREVLRVLLDEVLRAGVPLIAPAEVQGLEPPAAPGEPWRARLSEGEPWRAQRVVLATGGKSLPKTGSRGFGLGALSRLGHEVREPVPALTPLEFAAGPLSGLAGLTVPVVLSLGPQDAPAEQWAGKKFKPAARAAGSLLVTHQGATGPAPFDVSGPAGRALREGGGLGLRGDFWSLTLEEGPWVPFLGLDKAPGASLPPGDAPRPPGRELFFAQAEPLLARRERELGNALSQRLPRSLARGLLSAVELDPSLPIKQLNTRQREQLYRALCQAELRVTGSGGYAKAEVTSGGVLLAELTPKELESRVHPGLFCCGEVVNVTGRLGGFNFQWAWSSGFAAGRAAAASLAGAGSGK